MSRPGSRPIGSVLLIALVPVTANLAALAVNFSSAEERMPPAAEVLRRHSWLSAGLLTALSAALGVWYWRRHDHRTSLDDYVSGRGLDGGEPLTQPLPASPIPAAETGRAAQPVAVTHVHGPLVAPSDVDLARAPVSARAAGPPVGELPRVRGRKDILDDITRVALAPDANVHVLTGFGGCGKSTIALAVADRITRGGCPVWWVPARSRSSALEGLLAMAAELGATAAELSRAREHDYPEIAWQLLSLAPGPWMLVFDNADDPLELTPPGASLPGGTGWIRGAHRGLVLVTSRITDQVVWGRHAVIHRIGALDPASGTLMILDRLTDDHPGVHADSRLTAEAGRIAARLGHVPLALHLAGSYLGSGLAAMTVATYRCVLEDHSIGMVDLAAKAGLIRDGSLPHLQVLQTWEISLNSLAEQGMHHARTLLRLLSWFAPSQPIPLPLVDPTVLANLGLFSDSGGDPAEVLLASLHGLKMVGLLESVQIQDWDPEHHVNALVLHPLVAEVSVLHLTRRPPEAALVYGAAVALLAAAVHRLDPAVPEEWPKWQTLTPHARSLLDSLVEATDSDVRVTMIDIANNVVKHLRSFGVYQAAEELVRYTLTKAATLRHDDRANLMTWHNLATILHAQGDFRQAEEIYRRVLGEQERSRTIDPSDAADTRHSLALVLLARGELADAEEELQRVLAEREEGIGADSPVTVAVRHNLASAFFARGKLVESERLLREVLADRSAILGDDHPHTLATRHSLAQVLQARGQLRDAEALFREVLTDRERRLGSDHPNTLLTRHNLAWLLQARGDLDEAADMFHTVLAAQEQRLGLEHPHTLTTRANLAWVLQGQGRLDSAKTIFLQVLRDRERKLGMDHPDTLSSRANLGWLQYVKGDFAKAEAIFNVVLTDRVRRLGVDHPRVLATRHNLALVLFAKGQLDQASAMFESITRDQEQLLGPAHPATLASRHNFALALYARGEQEQAVAMLRQVLAHQEAQTTHSSPDISTTRANLDLIMSRKPLHGTQARFEVPPQD